MSKITESAKGQPCHLRFPWVCMRDSTTTVAAHIRIAGLAGVGSKPPDVCIVYACDACHSMMDGRTLMTAEVRADLYQYVLEGHLRTLSSLWERGIIVCA